MERVRISDFRSTCSAVLDRVARTGKPVLVTRRGRPIADIRAVARPRQNQRPFGLSRGRFSVPDSFHEPLTEEELARFEGGSLLPGSE